MSEQAPADEPLAPLPPLRIHHFLVWMAVAAAMFSLQETTALSGASNLWEGTSAESLTEVFFSVDWISLVDSLMQSLCTTCLVYGIYWYSIGLSFPSQPGHGLVFLLSARLMWVFVNYTILALSVEQNESGQLLTLDELPAIIDWYFSWQWNIWSLIEGLLMIGYAVWITRNLRWRFLLVWLGTYTLPAAIVSVFVVQKMESMSLQEINSYVYWNGIAYTTLAIFTGLFLLAVIILDRREGKRYHWSHWCGVGGFLLVTVTQLASAVWEYLFPADLGWSAFPPV